MLCQIYERTDINDELLQPYRIADNSFVIVCETELSQKIQQQVSRIQSGYLIENYNDVSIHLGASLNTDVNDTSQWLRQAEHRLYNDLSIKRRERHVQRLSHI